MKVLFVGRSVAHFSYYETIVTAIHRRGHQIEILFDEQWSRSPFGDSLAVAKKQIPKLNVGWAIRRNDRWRSRIFRMREIRSFASYAARDDQSDFYLQRWQAYLGPDFRKWTEKKWARRILCFALTHALMSAFERLVPPDPEILHWIEQKCPDVLVASPANMRFSEEIDYIKAAQAIGIPTVVPVLSWDNLTTKGLFHVIPDLILLWNKAQRDQALRIHKVPEKKILITGSPFFDKWFNSGENRQERSVFCQRVGIDPQKPFLTYLGSSANIAQDETWLVKEIMSQFRDHSDSRLREMSLLVRPHPANAKNYENLMETERMRVWPKKGALPEVTETQKDFYNSIYHSVGTVGINTTGMIDAIILDKPCLTVLATAYRATQEQAAHFKELLYADVLEVTDSMPELAQAIQRLMNGEDRRGDRRLKFTREFVRPCGLEYNAGDIAAIAIECAAKKWGVAAISRKIGHLSVDAEGNQITC